MLRDRLGRLLEELVPWYDRVAEARRHERSRDLQERSEAALAHASRALGEEPTGVDRVRSAYQAYANGLKR